MQLGKKNNLPFRCGHGAAISGHRWPSVAFNGLYPSRQVARIAPLAQPAGVER
jgi:RES domain-containing protein